MAYPRKSKRTMYWHGRIGKPIIHKCKTTGKTYVMVRAKVEELDGFTIIKNT